MEQILVVDDDQIKRYTTARILEKAGYSTIQASSGTEALEMAQQRPSLIVLDVKLPDIVGFEVCRRIKAVPATADLPVLHLSAHRTTGSDLAHGLEGGADAYLTLPVEPEVLVATVRALLRLHRAEESAKSAARYWQATFDAIGDAIFLVDPAGNISQCNEAAVNMLGATSDFSSPIKPPFYAIMQRLGIDGLDSWLTATQEAPEPVEVQASNGRWLRMTASRVSGSGTVCILADITGRVEAEQERARAAEKDARIAETLQRSLLLTPGVHDFPGMEVESVYEAAWEESMIGGDFNDVVALNDNHVAFVVGDVTGKGLMAATYTAEIKFALRAFLRESSDPARALHRLNHFLLESRRFDPDPKDTYVSLALAVVNSADGHVSYASAGAEPLLIIRSQTKETEFHEANGPLLAIDENSLYHTAATEWASGDLLLLTTDGITEARKGRGREFFGAEGMARAAQAALPLPTLREMAESIVRSALDFAGGRQHDDICLLIARCEAR